MATFAWRGVSGLWTDPNQWLIGGISVGTVPGLFDTAIAGGAASYTITVVGQQSVQDFTLDDSSAQLKLGDGIAAVAQLTAGGGPTINAGTVVAAAATSFIQGGSVTNNGTILSTGLGAFQFSISAQNIFVNNGLISIDGDHDTISSQFNIINAGTIAVADAGTLNVVGLFANPGLMTMASGGTLDLGVSTPLVSGTVQFLDASSSTLVIRTIGVQTISTTVTDFRQGNTIDLPTLSFSVTETAGLSKTPNLASDQIIVRDNGNPVFVIPVAGIPIGNFINVGDDGQGNAQLTMVACFAAGTAILTPRGEVAVEQLKPGDDLCAELAVVAPILWIGQRTIDCARHPDPTKVWPVRIAAGAFADGVPSRDLYLSPDHAVYANKVLIPVRYLVNGSTITQVRRDEIAYYHIELPHHDVVFAEGLAAETYLDSGDRAKFANGGAAVTLHPDFSSRVWEAMGCARLVITGQEIADLRCRIDERAHRTRATGACAAAAGRAR